MRANKRWVIAWSCLVGILAGAGIITAWSVGLFGEKDAADDGPATSESRADKAIKDLRSLRDVLVQELGWGKSDWKMVYVYQTAEPLPPLYVPTRCREIPDVRESESSTLRALLLAEHKSQLRILFIRLRLLGSTSYKFVPPDPIDGIPVRFARIDDKSCLLITDVALEREFNTIQLSARERARRVVREQLLPALLEIKDAIGGSSFEYIGISAYYGARNFLDEGRAEPEAVCLVSLFSDVFKLDDLEISEDEFLRRARVYASDRDMGPEIKRIELLND